MEFGRYKKKEGIYSPITQNQQHMDLMKKVAGFGEVKVEKYGEDIIGIVRLYIE